MALNLSSIFELIVIGIIICNIRNGYIRGFINTMVPIVAFCISALSVRILVKPVSELLVPWLGKGIIDVSSINVQPVKQAASIINMVSGSTKCVDQISQIANNMIGRFITYAILFSVIYSVVRYFLYKLNFFANLPIIKPINHMMGLAVGVAKSALEVWVSYFVINILMNAGLNMNGLSAIFNQSMIYRYVNAYNPLLNLI